VPRNIQSDGKIFPGQLSEISMIQKFRSFESLAIIESGDQVAVRLASSAIDIFCKGFVLHKGTDFE
jgi:hypothetical protein